MAGVQVNGVLAGRPVAHDVSPGVFNRLIGRAEQMMPIRGDLTQQTHLAQQLNRLQLQPGQQKFHPAPLERVLERFERIRAGGINHVDATHPQNQHIHTRDAQERVDELAGDREEQRSLDAVGDHPFAQQFVVHPEVRRNVWAQIDGL